MRQFTIDSYGFREESITIEKWKSTKINHFLDKTSKWFCMVSIMPTREGDIVGMISKLGEIIFDPPNFEKEIIVVAKRYGNYSPQYLVLLEKGQGICIQKKKNLTVYKFDGEILVENSIRD